jgi:outer membrane protein assembly factor BamB
MPSITSTSLAGASRARILVLSLSLIALVACGDDSPTQPDTVDRVLTSLTISPSTVTLAGATESVQLTAASLDQDGRAMNVALDWSSSDPEIATVSPSGLVTALREGSVEITISANSLAASAAVAVATDVGHAYWMAEVDGGCRPPNCELRPAAVAFDGAVYVPDLTGRLHAYGPDGRPAWTFRAGSALTSTPVVDSDGTVYVVAEAGTVHAIHPDGSERWSADLGDFTEAALALATDGTLYVANGAFFGGGELTAIGSDGAIRWRYDTGSPIIGQPSIGPDGTIYVGHHIVEEGQQHGALLALNSDGTVRWEFQSETLGGLSSAPSIGADGTVYVGAAGYLADFQSVTDGRLYALNPDGSLAWSYETEGAVFYSPAIGTDGSLYVVSGGNQFDRDPTGTVYAVNPDGTLAWSSGLAGCPGGSATVGADGSIFVPIAGCVFGGVGILASYSAAGALTWEFETLGEFKVLIGSVPILANGTLYAVSQLEGQVYAVRSESMGLADSAWPKAGRDNQNSGSGAGAPAGVAGR